MICMCWASVTFNLHLEQVKCLEILESVLLSFMNLLLNNSETSRGVDDTVSKSTVEHDGPCLEVTTSFS
jgi:hypothetical protein